MEVILSKKGFDTAHGGSPSIIDGNNLYSIPVPACNELYRYSDLKLQDGRKTVENMFDAVKPYYKSIYENGKSKPFTAYTTCHPDPNLTNYFESANFLGSLGQQGTAQSHLEKQNVGIGDLFIFFGWFNHVQDGKFLKSKGKHVIFGYLQVGEIIYTQGLNKAARRDYENKYPWLERHPHWNDNSYTNNCIYVATPFCSFDKSIKGYGTFAYSPKLDLTSPTATTMREWHIPALANLSISSMGGRKVAPDGTITLPQTFGQEYVIEESDKATQWAEDLIKNNLKRI